MKHKKFSEYIKNLLEVSDLSGTLIYLLSNMSQFVNGQNIIADDGFTI